MAFLEVQVEVVGYKSGHDPLWDVRVGMTLYLTGILL